MRVLQDACTRFAYGRKPRFLSVFRIFREWDCRHDDFIRNDTSVMWPDLPFVRVPAIAEAL
jgi:hypothetical protein